MVIGVQMDFYNESFMNQSVYANPGMWIRIGAFWWDTDPFILFWFGLGKSSLHASKIPTLSVFRHLNQ